MKQILRNENHADISVTAASHEQATDYLSISVV